MPGLRTIQNDMLADGGKLTNLPNISSPATGTGTKYLRDDGQYATPPDVGGVWGAITGTLSNQADLDTALNTKALKTTTVNGQALSGNVTLTTDDISEGATNKYDKTVVLNSGTDINVTGTYPNFTINSTGGGGGSGDVTGPSSSTDNALARFDSTTGKIIQNGVITESENGDLSGANSIQMDITPTTPLTGAGAISWNAGEGTLDIGMDANVTLQVGQESYWFARNDNGSTLPDGTVVYASGTIGASGRIKVKPYIADGSISGIFTLGITTESIGVGADGYVTHFGKIRGINTTGSLVGETWVDGDVLYASPTTSGALTKVKPAANKVIIPIAFVIHAHTNGVIAVRVPTVQSPASDIFYDNTTSGLTAFDVKSAIDELNSEKANLTGATFTGSISATNLSGTNTGDDKTAVTGILKGDGTTISSAADGTDYTTSSSTETFTNKRITSRLLTISSSATPSINSNNYDAVTITALSTNITSMSSGLTGSPNNFDKLLFRIKDDGTARTITWGSSFESKGVTLPTTTVSGKVLTIGFIYDSVTSKWGCVASAQEA